MGSCGTFLTKSSNHSLVHLVKITVNLSIGIKRKNNLIWKPGKALALENGLKAFWVSNNNDNDIKVFEIE